MDRDGNRGGGENRNVSKGKRLVEKTFYNYMVELVGM